MSVICSTDEEESGQGENLEDVHQYHPKRELECGGGGGADIM